MTTGDPMKRRGRFNAEVSDHRPTMLALTAALLQLGYTLDTTGHEPALRCIGCESGAVLGERVPHADDCVVANPDTPRTDALISRLCPYLDGEVTAALEAHARQLERELGARGRYVCANRSFEWHAEAPNCPVCRASEPHRQGVEP
jgi:hypothetical protein